MKILANCSGQILRAPALLLALAITTLILSACASVTKDSETSSEALVDRAQDRWAALLANDYEKAFSYYSPGYRSTRTAINFAVAIKARRVQWQSAEYREHNCLENSCTFQFEVGYKVSKPVPGLDAYEYTSRVEEKWVKTEGQWWYVAK